MGANRKGDCEGRGLVRSKTRSNGKFLLPHPLSIFPHHIILHIGNHISWQAGITLSNYVHGVQQQNRSENFLLPSTLFHNIIIKRGYDIVLICHTPHLFIRNTIHGSPGGQSKCEHQGITTPCTLPTSTSWRVQPPRQHRTPHGYQS